MPYWLNDKYLTYLLIAFVRSRYEPAWNGLLKLIRESLPKLLKTRYFKLLINKFISLEIIDIIQTLHQTLVRVRKEDVHLLACNPQFRPEFHYYLLLVFLTANLSNLSSLV